MDRRLPGGRMVEQEHMPSPVLQLIIRILLIAAVVASLLLGALMYLPGEKLLVTYWIYIVMMALPLVLLLAALTLKLYQSIRSKWPRLIATWLCGMVVMFVIVVVYSLSTVYTQVGMNPIAYYTNPDNGNRLVIMRAMDFESTDEGAEKPTYAYGGYPMADRFFYYPNRGDMLASEKGIDYVEWVDDGMGAAIHITDLNGAEQVLNISFDFSQPVAPPEDAAASDAEQPAAENAETSATATP